MENILFPDGTLIHTKISFFDNICSIESNDVPSDTSRIELVSDSGTVYGIYDGYTTVYRFMPGITQLSNDGSVWGEPEPDPTSDASYDLTLEERINDLEMAVCELADALA